MQKVINSGMQQLLGVEKQNTDDTAKNLNTLGFTISRGSGAVAIKAKPIDKAFIYVETNDIRIGAGTLLAATGILVAAGNYVRLESAKEVIETQFISAVPGVHATLHVQAGFDS